ncbi:MAG: hypothetical protein LBV12_03020 [Puniceicoccales bacterium]|nr:hypothetical protein [Puniceicoccales bacterium]
MKNIVLFSALAALISGCTTRELDTVAGNVGRTVAYPVTGPVTAIANSAPLSTTTTYTYWKAVPGTNTYEPYTTNKPLTIDEQRALGILPTPESQ